LNNYKAITLLTRRKGWGREAPEEAPQAVRSPHVIERKANKIANGASKMIETLPPQN